MATTKRDLLPGMLDMLVLKTLTVQDMHGYSIAQHLQRLSNDAIQVEEGSLYPALYRLEERGWVKSEWGKSENNRRARFYSLTAAGRRQLGVEEENWRRLVLAVGKVMQTA